MREEPRKIISLALVVVLCASSFAAVLSLSFGLASPVHAALVCTPVLTSRGALTTASTDQTTGTIDATGCDIGDYIVSSISVSSLTVHDANQYGIFVDSGLGAITVSISKATVSNIGAHTGTAFTPNGVQ